MERIQQYMNGEITTSTIANANGNWQFHEKANDNVNWYKTHYKWAWSQEHNLNINGGSDKANIMYQPTIWIKTVICVTEMIPMNVFQPMQNLMHNLLNGWI